MPRSTGSFLDSTSDEVVERLETADIANARLNDMEAVLAPSAARGARALGQGRLAGGRDRRAQAAVQPRRLRAAHGRGAGARRAQPRDPCGAGLRRSRHRQPRDKRRYLGEQQPSPARAPDALALADVPAGEVVLLRRLYAVLRALVAYRARSAGACRRSAPRARPGRTSWRCGSRSRSCSRIRRRGSSPPASGVCSMES